MSETERKELEIRAATTEDLPGLLAFTGAGSEASRWPQGAWEELLGGGEDQGRRTCVLLLSGRLPSHADQRSVGEVLGWIGGSALGSTAEVEFLLVDPEMRSQGLGGRLLQAFLTWARENGAQEVLLEVRASNTPAQKLYLRAGFEVAGRRRAYYREPVEEAVCMRLNLCAPGSGQHP